MLFKDTINEAYQIGFKQYLEKSDMIRQATLQDFAAFYYNDYEEIKRILKTELLLNPFSQATLDKLRFQHINIIDKVLLRLSGGIYKDKPLRYLDKSGSDEQTKFELLTRKIKYNQTIKESFRRAIYFNVVIVQPVFDPLKNRIRLDIINPNDIKVKTTNDYNELKEIVIRKADNKGNEYYSVWNASEHYVISGGNRNSPEGNPEMINPYGKLPFSVLRIKEGIDFYGEPNWNLFLNQKYFDIRLTDFDKSEMDQIQTAWLSVNLPLEDGDTINANKIIRIKNVTADDYPPSLEAISANVDYTSIRDNIEWKIQTMFMSEGLSSASGSTDITSESGISKLVDENELYEKREDYKETLYDFEIDLLENIRMVNNYHAKEKINDKKLFEVVFSEEKPMESITDKIARREMEEKYGYKNAVTFTMEDLEVSETEAMDIIQKVKQQNAEMNMTEENSEVDVNKLELENENFDN